MEANKKKPKATMTRGKSSGASKGLLLVGCTFVSSICFLLHLLNHDMPAIMPIMVVEAKKMTTVMAKPAAENDSIGIRGVHAASVTAESTVVAPLVSNGGENGIKRPSADASRGDAAINGDGDTPLVRRHTERKLISCDGGVDIDLDTSTLVTEFKKSSTDFLYNSLNLDSKDVQNGLDVTIPLVGLSYTDIVGGFENRLQELYEKLVSELQALGNLCLSGTQTILSCEDGDFMTLDLNVADSRLDVILCPKVDEEKALTLKPAGLFDNYDGKVEIVPYGTIRAGVIIGFKATLSFSIDSEMKLPTYNNDIAFPYPFTVKVEIYDAISMTIAFGLIDMTSEAYVKASAKLNLTPITDGEGKSTVDFDVLASYNIEGSMKLAFDDDKVPAGIKIDDAASFKISNADAYGNSPPIVTVDGFPAFADLKKFDAKDAITWLHVLDSALVRAQENILFDNVELPLTDKTLSEVLGTGSVVSNWYVIELLFSAACVLFCFGVVVVAVQRMGFVDRGNGFEKLSFCINTRIRLLAHAPATLYPRASFATRASLSGLAVA